MVLIKHVKNECITFTTIFSFLSLQSDIMDVNQIFKDLATMVHEQGEVVDSIEANVEAAQVHVSQASTQLSEARQYQVSLSLISLRRLF